MLPEIVCFIESCGSDPADEAKVVRILAGPDSADEAIIARTSVGVVAISFGFEKENASESMHSSATVTMDNVVKTIYTLVLPSFSETID